MTWALLAALFTGASLLVIFLISRWRDVGKQKRPVNIGGFCQGEYAEVKETFRKNFTDGWEAEGAALAVYRDGELVVDLWGGYSEKEYDRPWREETMSTIFSMTKSLAAICFAMQVERGACAYADAVVKYWPEYGANGKEETTIEMVLHHQSGVLFLNNPLDLEDILDDHRMDAIIESETPSFRPGTKTAYHPITFGWLVDGVFRRIDSERRSLAQFYKEEIQDRHDIDVYMGNCQKEEFRIANLKPPTTGQIIRECLRNTAVVKAAIRFLIPYGQYFRCMQNMRNFGKDFTLYNNPDLRIRGQPAVNGVGTARGVAKLHQILAEGRLVGKETLQAISVPRCPDQLDEVLGGVMSKGLGWMYWRGPEGNWQLGHSGVGGQNVRLDFKNGIVYAYICNGMKVGSGSLCFTFNRLEKTLFECLRRERTSGAKSG